MVRLGPHVGFVDLPDGDLKIHEGAPVPLGGVGILVGLLTGLVIVGEHDPALLVAGLVVFAVGLADDRFGLAPTTRIVGVVVAGLLLGALSDQPSGLWAVLAIALLTLVLVNAMNLIDGLDGLAGGTTVAIVSGMALIMEVLTGSGGPAMVVGAAVLGFLAFNIRPARAFLGDNGAYLIGLALTWLVAGLATNVSVGLLAIALTGVPLLDLGATILRRVRTHSKLFTGDRDHLYDRLAARIGQTQVVLVYVLFQIVWAGLLIVLWLSLGAAPTLAVALAGGLVIAVVGSYSPAREPFRP